MNVIRSEREFTPAQRVAMGEVRTKDIMPGRPKGGKIADMVGMKMAIMLCPSCRPKFNKEGAGYVNKENLPFAAGDCDGCGEFHPRMELMVDKKFACNL